MPVTCAVQDCCWYLLTIVMCQAATSLESMVSLLEEYRQAAEHGMASYEDAEEWRHSGMPSTPPAPPSSASPSAASYPSPMMNSGDARSGGESHATAYLFQQLELVSERAKA